MKDVSTFDLVAYVVLPYAAMTTFVVGHIWRYRFDRFGWSSRSSELYERKWLSIGGPMFHYGAFMVIGGHILGIVIPESFTEALGITESQYTLVAQIGGVTGLTICVIGLAILLIRRVVNGRVRRATSRTDVAAMTMLWLMVILGTITTVGYNVLGPGYNYRPSVAVWWRSILMFQPDPAALSGVPTIYLLHISIAWFFFALFPFTRLVHAWSAPVTYLTRPYVVYRRRDPSMPHVPGTSRTWDTIGRDSHR
ncbi:MAG: respiratory nitrate reductase subunit gamma [Microthrixaceae bacterium]